MNVKNVFIITSEPFPMGMAGTNRIISYAKGFLSHGKEVDVVCFRKTEQKDKVVNKKTKGKYEGVVFRYLTRSTIKSYAFIKKRIDDLYAYVALLLWGLKRVNSNALCIYYSFHTIPAVILRVICFVKGGVLLKEENEHPVVRLRLKNKIEKVLFQNLHYRLFDGFLLITETLMAYFKEQSIGKTPMLLVPMMIDFERFDRTNREMHNTKEIVYCGEITIKKDGVDILVKAFEKISEIYNNFTLSLYGWGPREDESKVLSLIKKYNLENKVFFRGLVSRDVITEKILNAGILVLPRPDSIQARHGFSTKLGEYLATGNPVLATSVGEIPEYLTDNENVFFANPGDVQSLTEKLLFIIDNYAKAKEVALKGRDFANDHFSNIKHTATVLSFVEQTF